MKKKITKHGFSLLEVLISFSLLGIALSPLLEESLFRIKTYKRLIDKIYAQSQCEERFFAELARIGISNEISYETLEKGYSIKETLPSHFDVEYETQFCSSQTSQEHSKVRLGNVSVIARSKSDSSIIAKRSTYLVFQEKE